MAGTAWNIFVSHSLGQANKVDENFDWIEGAIEPMNAGSKANDTYDLGSATYVWRTGYFSTAIILGESVTPTTISTFDNSTLEVSSGNIRVKSGGIKGSTANSGGSAQEVSQGTISTPDLRANAVTNQINSGSGSLATGTTLTSAAITTIGGSVLIVAHATI